MRTFKKLCLDRNRHGNGNHQDPDSHVENLLSFRDHNYNEYCGLDTSWQVKTVKAVFSSRNHCYKLHWVITELLNLRELPSSGFFWKTMKALRLTDFEKNCIVAHYGLRRWWNRHNSIRNKQTLQLPLSDRAVFLMRDKHTRVYHKRKTLLLNHDNMSKLTLFL